MKFLILVYSLLFLTPLYSILSLPNGGWLLATKGLLIFWMLFMFLHTAHSYRGITLHAFLCFVGLSFVLLWFSTGTLLAYVFSFVLLFLFYAKFRQIDKFY